MLGIDINVIEDGNTPEENATKKAQQYYEATRMPVIAEIQRRIYPCGEIGKHLFTQMVDYNNSEGAFNKMFVKSDLMPHHIKITNIRMEQLQTLNF